VGYLEQVRQTNRPIINVRYYTDGDTCVAEFEVDLADGEVAGIVDVFTLNSEGEISTRGLPPLTGSWTDGRGGGLSWPAIGPWRGRSRVALGRRSGLSLSFPIEREL
jgi:hypothetical protein